MSVPAFPLIQPLLEQLQATGVSLSEKALLTVNVAAHDAKLYQYRTVYDDNVFTGLLQTTTLTAGLFHSLGIDALQLTQDVHAPIPSDYRRTYSRTKNSKRLNSRHTKPIQIDDGRNIWAIPEYGPENTVFGGLSGTVSSSDLLLRALARPAVWRAVHSHGISVNQVKRQVAELAALDPDIETQKYVLSEDNGRYSLTSFDLLAGTSVSDLGTGNDGVHAARINLASPRKLELGSQIERFEWLINQPKVSEYDIQKFLESAPNFLLGLEYKSLHSQLTMVREDRPSLRPDFFLERVRGDFCDILDIKLPTSPLVVGTPNRRTFSAAVISAMGQLRKYRNYFDDPANVRIFQARYGLNAYKPKIQVVIGRSSSYADHFERAVMEDELKNLQIITFDDILDRVRQQLRLIG